MQRRNFNLAGWAAILAANGFASRASSQDLASLSNTDALGGIRAALVMGAKAAVSQLGQAGGFLNNPKVRIGLPGVLEKAAPLLKTTGLGNRLEELVVAMNSAAEQAVPMAADLLSKAIKEVSVGDARRILGGGDTAVTDFFASKTQVALTEQFLPVVKRTTENVKLTEKYQAVAGRAAKLGLIKQEDSDLPSYVTSRALAGLYQLIGEEERKIRQNPAEAGSALLKKVFSAR